MIAIDEEALAQHVGEHLRQARRARKWKQAQVASAIGISVQFYGRIERGAGLPSMTRFVDLLASFELTPSAVLGGAPAPTAWAPGDPPVLRRSARRSRRAPASVLALVRELIDTEGIDPAACGGRAGSGRATDLQQVSRGALVHEVIDRDFGSGVTPARERAWRADRGSFGGSPAPGAHGMAGENGNDVD